MAGINRAGRVAGWVVALALCGIVALGLARRHDIQFELGYAYENGQFHGWTPGFAQDYRKAFYWLGLAAQANHPRAQYMLGILVSHGWGVPRDSNQAVEWFTRSARNGYAPASYHLGWMVHKGDDVPRDDARSIRLMEQAAGQGMAAAQLALGRFYERGEGVSVDAVQALKWYAQAVHFARSRPDLFDNAAFLERAQAAHDALAERMNEMTDK
ncbi:MAG: tetratricopeptide repeat protein [Thiobacillus sp.]